MKPIRLPGKPDIRHADLLCMCKSITQSMCMQCTSTAFHKPGPTAHMLFLAIAQISAPHFPVLVLKFTLKYPGNFLSCSSFVWTEKKFPSIYACFLYKPGYRISASTMCLGTGVYETRGGKVSVAWKCQSSFQHRKHGGSESHCDLGVIKSSTHRFTVFQHYSKSFPSKWQKGCDCNQRHHRCDFSPPLVSVTLLELPQLLEWVVQCVHAINGSKNSITCMFF